MKEIFDTPNLELRHFEDVDLHSFYCILDDNNDGKALDFNTILEDFKNKEKNHHYYAIVLKKYQTVIGSIYCKKVNDKDFEIGYLLKNNYKDSGYASEALYGFVKMLEAEGLQRIVKLESGKEAKPYKLLADEGFLSINSFYKVFDFMKD